MQLYLKENTYEKELFGEEFEDGNISFGALERANKGTLLLTRFQKFLLKHRLMFLEF